MKSNSTPVQARAQVGVAVRTGNKRLEVEARQNLAIAKIESFIKRISDAEQAKHRKNDLKIDAYIKDVIAEAPPLTTSQFDRIANFRKPLSK